MLALVKKPRIEVALHGEHADEVLAWLREKYEVAVLSSEDVEDSVSIEDTDFWREMERNRVGNLLAGARLKAGLTQTSLAKKLGIHQNMVSDYERGRRTPSASMLRRFRGALKLDASHFPSP